MDEAPTLVEYLSPSILRGELSSGDPWEAAVFFPNPYTFSIMKIFAFRDRIGSEGKEFGRYHALDLYTILATTTEEEWRNALKLANQQAYQPIAVEAGSLVTEHFSALDQLGMVRLRESPYYRRELQLEEFMSILQELFPAPSKAQ